MSAVVKPVLAPASPAAVNAAAASFAALVAKLDYMGPEGLDLVLKAYRYADQATTLIPLLRIRRTTRV